MMFCPALLDAIQWCTAIGSFAGRSPNLNAFAERWAASLGQDFLISVSLSTSNPDPFAVVPEEQQQRDRPEVRLAPTY
jgi:hypothetical protein